ncbi:MAG: hypothetical protein PUD64_00195 [Bacteroidales bacterium]|nr:hypothetical protein [Bacteroidales bacterium]
MTQYQIISNDPGGTTIIRQTVSPRSQALREQRNGGKSHHRQRRCQEADISTTPAGVAAVRSRVLSHAGRGDMPGARASPPNRHPRRWWQAVPSAMHTTSTDSARQRYNAKRG